MDSTRAALGLLLWLVAGCGGNRENAVADSGSDTGGEAPTIDVDWLAVPSIGELAADDSHVYFVHGAANLARVPRSGGTAEMLYTAGASSFIEAVHLGGNDVVLITNTLEPSTLSQTRRLIRLPKSGGASVELTSSMDSRAFLGATVAGDHAYFSTFTSVHRIPLAGGSPQLVGRSPDSVRYWVYSPAVVGDQLYWAELGRVFRMTKTDPDHEGDAIADLAGMATILGADHQLDHQLVVGLATTSLDYGAPIDSFVVVDGTTGLAGPVVTLGTQVRDADVASDGVWAAAATSVLHVSRTGGAVEQLPLASASSIVTTDDHVFVGTATGIARIAR